MRDALTMIQSALIYWRNACTLNPGRFSGGRKVSRQVAIDFTFRCDFLNYALAIFTFAPTLPRYSR